MRDDERIPKEVTIKVLPVRNRHKSFIYNQLKLIIAKPRKQVYEVFNGLEMWHLGRNVKSQ